MASSMVKGEEKEVEKLVEELKLDKIIPRTKRNFNVQIGRDMPKSGSYMRYSFQKDYMLKLFSHDESVYNTDRRPSKEDMRHLEGILPKLCARANKKHGRTEVLDDVGDPNLKGIYYDENPAVQLGLNNYDKQVYNIRRRCTSFGFSLREMFKKARKIK